MSPLRIAATATLLALLGCDSPAKPKDDDAKPDDAKADDAKTDDAKDKAPKGGADGVRVMVGTTNRFDDNVDLARFKTTFGCDAAATPKAERACEAIKAFETGGKVKSYPAEDMSLFFAVRDCEAGSTSRTLTTVALKPGTPPGDVDDEHRAPGTIWPGFQSTAAFPSEEVKKKRTEALAAVREALIKGEPDLTPAQLDDGTGQDSWAAWREDFEKFPAKPVATAQSNGTSLLEDPAEPGPFPDPSAWWRESNGTLIRVSRAGWCVEHYLPIPKG